MCNKLADELEQRIGARVRGARRSLSDPGHRRPCRASTESSNNIMRTSGGAVVCEEIVTGTATSRTWWTKNQTTWRGSSWPFTSGTEDQLRLLHPNTGRIDDILRMVKEYQVDGVIDCSLKFSALSGEVSGSPALKEAGLCVRCLSLVERLRGHQTRPERLRHSSSARFIVSLLQC